MPKTHQPFYAIRMAKDMPEVLLIGYIGYKDQDGSGVLFNQFVRDFKELESKHTECRFIINSPGGMMYDGLAMYDMIELSSMKVHCDIIGLAASMAAIIPLACKGKIRASKNITYMTHKPSGGQYGSSASMRTYADHMDQLEKKAKTAMKSRTGQDDEIIDTWFQEGKDRFFTIEELLEYGIIDEIIEPVSAVTAPKKNKLTPESAWETYQAISMSFFQQNPDKMKQKILAMLTMMAITNHGLTEESTDEQFIQALDGLVKSKNDQVELLQTSLRAEQNKAIDAVLSDAVASGRLAETDKDTYRPLLTANFEAAKMALDRIPARQDINSNLFKKPGQESTDTQEDRKAWTIRDYEQKDPAALLQIMRGQPENYKKMFKDFYKQDPY